MLYESRQVSCPYQFPSISANGDSCIAHAQSIDSGFVETLSTSRKALLYMSAIFVYHYVCVCVFVCLFDCGLSVIEMILLSGFSHMDLGGGGIVMVWKDSHLYSLPQ
jgi:hypothetical protein